MPEVEPRPAPSVTARATRLLPGLVLLGTAMALMLIGDLGAAPWAVLDQGISRQTGVPVGRISVGVGAGLLLLWIPLRERPGVGTVLNALLVGLVIDLVMGVLDTPGSMAGRIACTGTGVLLAGPGSGLYIGARLGPGPRDGLMTGLARRQGRSIRLVRTCLEVAALIVGFALGGTVGVGTLAFALTIGPNVQFFLQRASLPEGGHHRPAEGPPPAPVAR